MHVLVGTNDDDYIAITSGARQLKEWVVPKAASTGEEVVLFVHSVGFVAFGKVNTPPKPGRFRGQAAYRSDIGSVDLLSAPVPAAHIRRNLPAWGWLNQRVKSRTTPPKDVAARLFNTIRAYQQDLGPGGGLGEPSAGTAQFSEGTPYHQLALRHERNPAARAACIAHYGSTCVVCRLSFADQYGPDVAGLIVVHHLEPLSMKGGDRTVVPFRDLRPVCANCHLVIHRRDPPYTVKEVREMIKAQVSSEENQ